ncbi:MAG: MOSC domain-containing protein [Paracoccaceae bacterium]
MGRLDGIRRHPIKGMGEDRVERIELTAGAPVPFDRAWAVALGGSGFDEAAPAWRHCREMMRVALAPELAQVRVSFDEQNLRLELSHPELGGLEFDPAAPDGAASVAAWIAPLADRYACGPYRLVSAPPAAMTDFEDTHVSIASLASLRALEEMAGRELDSRRFRMNLWFDGFAPLEELNWVDREIEIGEVRLRVTKRDRRCAATHANPETGLRDVELGRLLHERVGHMDFGVYAQVVASGPISVGDEVRA